MQSAALSFSHSYMPFVSNRQFNMLLWCFDTNGNVDPSMFLCVCEHEHIAYDDMDYQEQQELLQSLGMTSYLRSFPK